MCREPRQLSFVLEPPTLVPSGHTRWTWHLLCSLCGERPFDNVNWQHLNCLGCFTTFDKYTGVAVKWPAHDGLVKPWER